jgi:hypothetical protein
VIPTNPAYRRRARKLLAQAAASIGQGFARGAAAGKKRRRRPKKVYRGSHYLFPVEQLEYEIDMKDNALTQYDARYSTDARFKPLVDDNGQRIEENISWHLSQLADLERRANELARLERRLSNAIDKAHRQLRNAMERWQDQRPPATIIKGTGSNRKRVDNPKFKAWADKMNGLRDAFGQVPLDDANQAMWRADDYETQAYAYSADQREVRETKSAPLPAPGIEEWLASQGLSGSLQALNLGVAQAAATIGDTADDRAAMGGLASFWEGVVARLGPEGDKTLLTEAYQALAQAREGASAGTSGSSAPDIGVQTATFNAARDQLFREFGSNFFGAAAGGGGLLGAISSGASAGVISGFTDVQKSGTFQTSGADGAKQGEGGAGTTINQTNNFAAPPPDPHTFVKSTMWEAQAV